MKFAFFFFFLAACHVKNNIYIMVIVPIYLNHLFVSHNFKLHYGTRNYHYHQYNHLLLPIHVWITLIYTHTHTHTYIHSQHTLKIYTYMLKTFSINTYWLLWQIRLYLKRGLRVKKLR